MPSTTAEIKTAASIRFWDSPRTPGTVIEHAGDQDVEATVYDEERARREQNLLGMVA